MDETIRVLSDQLDVKQKFVEELQQKARGSKDLIEKLETLENHLLVHTGEKPALLKNSEGLWLIIFISLNPEEPDAEPYWGEATFWMRICKSREKDFISWGGLKSHMLDNTRDKRF